MKVNIAFEIIDSEYDQSYADEFHSGKESDGNYKYQYAVSYRVENVNEVKTRTGSLRK